VNWERDVTPDRELRLVRHYALTRGRTKPLDLDLPMETLLITADPDRALGDPVPERRRIAELCRRPQSVAEIAAQLRVPLGVARVLVADLVEERLINAHRPLRTDASADIELLERVLHGLHSL
jgi:hypothetical protein